MWLILFAGSLCVFLAVAVFLLRVTKVNHLPAYVTVLAFVAFFIPTFTVILLPIDLASGWADQENITRTPSWPLSYLSSLILLKIWRASYWLSFALTLTILPITQSFVESGYKEPLHRLTSSIRQNLRYQAIYLCIGLFGVLYIVFNTTLRSFSDFKSLLIALANTWGLFLAINFLGHGLVNIPRRLWMTADYRRQIRDAELKASTIHEKLEDAISDELDLAVQVVALEKTSADTEWLDDMAMCIPEAVAKARAGRARTTSGWFGSSRNQKDPTEAQLAELMSKIRKNKRERYQAEWNQLVTRYTYLLDCVNIKPQASSRHRTFRSRLNPTAAYWYYRYVLPLVQRFLALVAGSVSFSILWAELLINKERPFLRFVTLPITSWNIEIWSAILMSYMACCCYSTLLRLKIFDRHALLDYGHTTAPSLFFYASYCCRVTIPLSYNFVTLLPQSYRECSTFSRFLGSAIDLQPLGTAFNNWLPLYILVPVLLTCGNSYDRLKKAFGIGSTWIDDEDDDPETGSGAEGRELLRAEISRRFGELPEHVSRARTTDTQADEEEGDQVTDPFLPDQADCRSVPQYTAAHASSWSAFSSLRQGLWSVRDKLQRIGHSEEDPNVL